ncbi:MAG: 1-deoxy-D-xylulose-5-phosphate reductoisomerase [Candidatus Omnitrophica bacterium]|nr:1-deoxy-D-xylulose-5-phosphate reductoisomerase [Candidatus Omnitrophota bacterium]MDD5351863.1 1-deoxy-D-xylulose-5-phosphate reductoisomerase [Candidatus Omnitrophota bacterium]MDD5550689.1 1-deoxy-D-xylulose-5-phosphate reductoisomerase [Candidatus Omnitrophota bacterium]
MSRQNIVILGSTGSIGANTLEVVGRFKDKFRLIGISAGSNIKTLKNQIERFKPEFVAVYNEEKAEQIKKGLKGTKVFSGLEGVCRLASLRDVDTVVIAVTGSIALLPLLEAIRSNKKIALANKEALVVAGHIITEQLQKNPKSQIIPVDSEQNAIFQCLKGYDRSMINRIYLTASGGPLINCKKSNLKHVSPEHALAHPRWKMGKKITIDSATLMNKGLEVIEARWLFNIPLEKIKVVVHKEAIIHSLVEFIDGSMLGQLAVTDMKLPIQYALSFPERWYNNGQLKLDLSKLKSLSFAKPDFKKFPCLELAYYAASQGNMLPCVLNAANEEAVEAFLNHRIIFTKIPCVIEKLLKKHKDLKNSNRLIDLLELDHTARVQARELIGELAK